MKYIISGAAGWMGRATLHVLINQLGVEPSLIVGIGTKRSEIELKDGKSIPVKRWSDLPEKQSDLDIFFHYAFITRDKLNQISLNNYIRENKKITAEAIDLIRKYKPKHVVSVSSGAVYSGFGSTTMVDDLFNNPYGTLKLEEEKALLSVTEEYGSSLTVARLWNLSGEDIQNVYPFALSNFILDALNYSKITIRSESLVFRRYVDARQLAILLYHLAQQNRTIIFDTGGPLIELRDLAKEIANQIGKIEIIAPQTRHDLDPDRYYSESYIFELLCSEILNTEPLGMSDQVQATIAGLKFKK